MRTLGEVLRLSTAHLERHGSPTARLDAELLIGHALGLGRVELYTGFERPLGEAELAACRELIARAGEARAGGLHPGPVGVPRAGRRRRRRVLVPRPETELLVDRCRLLLDGAAEPGVARRRHRLGGDRAFAQVGASRRRRVRLRRLGRTRSRSPAANGARARPRRRVGQVRPPGRAGRPPVPPGRRRTRRTSRRPRSRRSSRRCATGSRAARRSPARPGSR